MLKNNRFVRTVAMLLCLSMVLGFVPGGILGSTTVAKAAETYFFEEQFDSCTPLGSWTYSSGSPKIYSSYYNNTNSLFFEGSNSPWAKSASFNVTAGTSYKLAVCTQRQSKGSPAGSMQIVFLDASGNELQVSVADLFGQEYAGSKTDDWMEETMVATAPVGAAKAYVMFQKQNANFGIDNVRVTETDTMADAVISDVIDTWPRLYFNAQELAEMKAHMNDNEINAYGFSWASQVSTLIANAEAYLKETTITQRFNLANRSVVFDVYPELVDPSNLDHYKAQYIAASTNDNGDLVEQPYLGYGCLVPDSLRVRMETLSLAYVLTGDTRYSDRAIHYAVSMAGWEAFGDANWMSVKVAHADASVAWATQGVAAVYDMCNDQLSDLEKFAIEEAIISKGLSPMSKQVDPNSIANGNMMFVGGMLTGIGAIIRDDNITDLTPYINRALYCVQNAMNNYAYSGNTEGHYYTGFGLDYFLPGVSHFYRATGLQDIVEHPLLSEMLPYWTTMFSAPNTNYHPNYSDAGVAVQLQVPMGVINKLTGDPLANYFLTQIGGIGTAFDNLIYLDPEPEVQIPTDRVAVVNPIGYGVLRSGFADGDMMLTLLANNSQMGHNHWDQNSIQFVVGGDWMIADPGVGSYYYKDRVFWQKSGHSTILVDGNAQSVKGTGSMEQVFNSALYGYIIGSAPKAYGSSLSKFDRHAIQLNHKDKAYYILIDDLASSSNHTFGWQMYNGARDGFTVDGTAISSEGTLSGNNVAMTVNGKDIHLTFVDGDKLSIKDKIYYGIDQNDNQILGGHTMIANSPSSKNHQFMAVLSAGEAVAVTQTIDTSNALAAMINYSRNLSDFVMFNRTTGSVTAGLMTTDAKQASVLGLKNGVITEGFAASDATKLTYNSRVLFEAASKLDIVADSEGWHIATASAQTVKLFVGSASNTFTYNGTVLPPDASGYITVSLPAGDSIIAVDAQQEQKPALGGVDSFANGDFSQGATVWEGFNENATVVDGVLNVNVAGAGSAITQAFAAKQRDLCDITLDYKYISGAGNPYVALYFYKDEVSQGSLIGMAKRPLTDKTSDWQKVTFSAQAPASSNVIEVRIGSELGATVSYQIDNVAVNVVHRALVNGGFEDDMTGWENIYPDRIFATNTDSFGGNYSLQLGSENNGGYIKQVFETNAYTLWEMKLKYKWISGDGSMFAGIWFYKDKISNAQNAVTGEYLHLLSASASTLDNKSGQWVESKAYFMAPAGCNLGQVEIGYHSKNTATYLMDDITLTKVGSYCYADFLGTTYTGTEEWTEFNGSTETVLDKVSNSDKVCRWGDNKLVFQAAASGKHYYAKSPEFAVEGGKKYTITFQSIHYIKSGSLTGDVDIVFLDADGNLVDAVNAEAYGGTPSAWMPMSVEAIAPDGAASAYIQFNYAASNSSNYYYIDELYVQAEGGEEPEPDTNEPVVVYSDAFESHYTPDGAASSVKIPVGWTASTYGSAALSCAKYDNYDGTYNLCLQDKGTKWIKTPAIAATPGYLYTANFVEKKLQPDVAGNGGYAKLIFTDAQGTVLLEEQIVAGASKTWTEMSIEAQAPANAAYVYVEFGTKNATGDPTYSVDKLKLFETEATFPEPTYPLNGDFENGTNYWSDSSAISINTSDKHGGSAALKFVDASASKAYSIYQAVEVEPGKTYELTGWVKNLSGTSGYMAINALFDSAMVSFDATSDWKQYSVIVSVPEDLTVVEIEIGSTTAGITTFLIDDLLLEEAAHVCADNNNDHQCDGCGETLSQCADADKDHNCDVCDKVLSGCADGNKDHKCDLCGKVLSDCADSSTDADHSCDLCGKENITTCKLAGHAYKCNCGKIMLDPVFKDEFDDVKVSWDGEGWKIGGTAYVLYDGERGSMVAKVEDLSTHIRDDAGNIIQRGSASEIISDKFPVASGVSYSLSFWYKQDASVVDIATGKNLPFSIQWFDADGVRIDPDNDGADAGKDYYTAINPALSTEWQKYEGTVQVPAGAAQAWIQLGVDTAGINVLYIDDIDFVKSPVAFTETFNGGIFSYGWTKSAGSSAMIYTHAVEGQALILQTKAGVFAQSPAIPVVPGYTYTAEFMHSKTSYDKGATYSVGSGGRAALIYVDARGNILDQTIITVGEQNGWEQADLAARAPANAANMYVKFFVDDSYTGDPCFTIDSLVVKETVGEVLQPTETPILTNGDFSNGTTGWTGNLTVNEDGQAVIPETAGSAYFKSGKISVTPGEGFHLSARVKRISGEKIGYIGFWYVDANGAYVGDGAIAVTYSSDEWTEVTMDWVAPAGVASFWIEFGVNSAQNSSFLVDDIKVTPLAAEEENGTIATPTYPQYHENFDDAAVTVPNWTGDGMNVDTSGDKAAMQLTGTAYSAAFAVIPGATYAIDLSAQQGVTAAIVWKDAAGAVIASNGNVAPANAATAQVVLTAANTAVVNSVAVYMVCADSDSDQDHACDTCGNVMGDCVNENGDHNCDICDKVLTACADADKDGKCDICGENLGPAIDEKAKFASTGLSLGTFIGLQSAIMKSAINGKDFDEAYFIYTNAAGETVRGEYMDMGSYFVADIPVNAKQMADVYEITPVYVNDGVTYHGVTKIASVKEESMKKVNDAKTDEKTENTRKLCVAMLNYGAEAQKNFKYNLDNLANSELSEAQKAIPAFKDLNLVKTNNIPTTPIKPASSGLNLGDVVYMQFLVKKTDVDAAGKLVYQIAGEAAVEIAVSDLEIYSNNYYLINIPIKAKYVRTDIAISFPTENYTMSCSVEGFAPKYEGKATETLVAALMAYGDAADVLF